MPGRHPRCAKSAAWESAMTASTGSAVVDRVEASHAREGPRGRHDPGQSGFRHAEEVEQARVPVPLSMSRSWVREAQPISVTGSAWPALTCARARRCRASPRTTRRTGCVLARVELVQQPLGLERREHRIERQARRGEDLARVPARVEEVGGSGGPLVLPAQDRADRFARPTVPDEHRLTLHAQGYTRDVAGAVPRHAVPHGALDAPPQLGGVLLDPARVLVRLTQHDGGLPTTSPRGQRSSPWSSSCPGRWRA